MITVSYSKNNEIISLIEVTGHALFAPKGQDIVCSAVSSIMIGGLNNLKRAAEYKIVNGLMFGWQLWEWYPRVRMFIM